ncbi:P-loop NTPase [Candidatus Woesearchaeota archaeon]|jgi:septum site-determining protein MinD|nr:P-loop NTPase [Candidatus Woesearchaeota archaeon]MBT6519383.1 P-loop NTPase [Candidatus Woesearchaeota archaeon]MBT7367494.1 P-loop NTPase [Candidatus Woesearchaeota archaeon]
MSESVCLISAKGGVGKTTFAINLASSLRYYGIESIIVDADFLNPCVALHLGFPNLAKTLNSAISGKFNVLDCTFKHNSGVKFIPTSTRNQDYNNLLVSNLGLHINILKQKTNLVILDSAEDPYHQFHTINFADHVIAVCTPSNISVHNTQKLIERVKSFGSNVNGIIINKHIGDEFDVSLQEIETKLGIPVLGVIPYDESVRQARQLKHPVVFSHPESKSATSFRRIAVSLLGR